MCNELNDSTIFYMYYRDIHIMDNLSQEEFLKLFDEYKNGSRKAFDEIILRNQRIIIDYSKRFVSRDFHIVDLIDEGNIGLIKALETYDKDYNCKFITYAYYFIKKYILMYLTKNNCKGRTGIKFYTRLVSIENTILEYYKIGIDITDEELAKIYNVSVEKIKKYRDFMKIYDISTSVNVNIYGELKDELINDIKDDNINYENEVLNEILLNELMNDIFDNNIAGMKKRTLEVLKLRYGIKNNKTLTQGQIGKLYNITHSRIGQIENDALKRLKKNKKVKQYYNDYCN